MGWGSGYRLKLVALGAYRRWIVGCIPGEHFVEGMKLRLTQLLGLSVSH